MSGVRSPETHFLNGSKNSEQPSMGNHFESGCPLTAKFLLTTAAQNMTGLQIAFWLYSAPLNDIIKNFLYDGGEL